MFFFSDQTEEYVNQYSVNSHNLVESDSWAHGGLDVERSHVLPLLLEERNQEVDAHVDVLDQLIVVHGHITDGNSQAQHLFHLELDGGLHLANFSDHVVTSAQNTWELTRLVQTWSQQSRDLSDQSVRSQESVVLFGELLDHFLSLLSFFKSSTDMCSMPCFLASSICAWLPKTQTVNFGLATFGNFTVPLNRLSFCGS